MNMQAQNYLRLGQQRGRANFGWLNSYHSFSFGQYYDPKHMGFSHLRVINDDTVAGGAGFPTHPHRDMEIISYVLEGAIEHKDTMGNSFVVPAGEVQRMSAGTGVAHSEFNHSATDNLRFLQIWIMPDQMGIEPSYEQANIQQTSALTPLVTPDGRDGSLSLNQDAAISRLRLEPGESFELDRGDRLGYLHMINGQLSSNDLLLNQGDALGLLVDKKLQVTAQDQAVEALWFDLPSR
ncbi:MAG: pirin family protein [Kangiellaceae bacterium]|jgi:redox-sensitive bicupin YhaK (pirin superfamily)|nr:pirin family protein [Kangiellaceae bacterium]